MRRIHLPLAFALPFALIACSPDTPPPAVDYSGPVADWSAYGASSGGGHFSAATQITPANVRYLQKAWEYRSGDFRRAGEATMELVAGQQQPLPATSWQMTPLLAEGTLYGCSSYNRMFALDPVSGREKWSFDPGVDGNKEALANCRGVSYWKSPAPTGAHCDSRVIGGTLDGRLIAVDAKDGKPCAGFGVNGQVSLAEGLGEYQEHEYSVSSTPAIVGERIVTGAMVIDRLHNNTPSGVVRAYDVRTGRLDWFWDAVPPGEKPVFDEHGVPRYRRGTTNVWSIISADPARDLVFLPTGNTSTDFYGG
ncbi:MAG: PQQ-binding-like beta-propeller repeat protein, partial [Gammaproteobacteria bacterium]